MKRSLIILRAVVVLACVAGIIAIVQYGKEAGLFGRKQSIRPPDYSKLMEIDPELIIYEELAPISCRITNATGLAAGPDGRIYVCGEKLLVLDETGKQAAEIALEAPAYSVGVDVEGLVYLCVGNHVEVYEATGERRAVWEAPQEDALLGTVLVKDDVVYVSDVKNHTLIWYDMTGTEQGRDTDFVVFGSRNIGLTVDDTGALWAADPGRRALKKYGDNMEPVGMWKRPGRQVDGFSGCCNPEHVAARKDGALVTSEKNIIRVKVVNQECELIGVVAGPEQLKGMAGAPAIAVAPDDRVLILDAGRRQVRVFALKDRAGVSSEE